MTGSLGPLGGGRLRDTGDEGGLRVRAGRIAHSFRNGGEVPGRMLVLVSPGGLERFFVVEVDAAGAAGTLDPGLLRALAREHGIEIVPGTP